MRSVFVVKLVVFNDFQKSRMRIWTTLDKKLIICKIDSIDGLELDFNMFVKKLFGMDGLEADFNMCWLNSLQTIAICQIVIKFDSI